MGSSREQTTRSTWPLLLLLIFGCCRAAKSEQTFHSASRGVIADGKTLVTASLQHLFDLAAAHGGGTIYLDPGTYLTGSLFIKSHTHLVLASGATLIGTTDPMEYPPVETRAAGIEMKWPAALLNIDGQTDVSIEGAGSIDGNGKPWWDAFWSRVPAYEARGLRWAVDYDVQRPELIRVYKASSIRIGRGLLLRRSAFWTVHICYSNDVIVSDLTIRDNDPVDGKGPSTDGIDIDSSTHVLVEKADISNNDDAICLKAGMNADGLRVNRPTEDVIIRDSVIREAISGIAIGSDTAGGFRDIRVSGITILSGVRYGIYLKSTHTRGGWTEGVHLSDITMHAVQTPIKIDLNYFPAFSTPSIPQGVENNLPPTLKQIPSYWKTLTRPVSQEEGTPHFRDITLSNVNADAARTAIDVNAAQDAPMERFSLQHVHLQGQHAGRIRHTADWQLMDVQIRAGDQITEEDMHGTVGIIKLIADQ